MSDIEGEPAIALCADGERLQSRIDDFRADAVPADSRNLVYAHV